MEKEAIRTFLEHKSEENAKDLIFQAGNNMWRRQEYYPDGVKSKVHDDPVQKWRRHQVERQELNTWRPEKVYNMTTSDVDQGSPRILLAARWRRHKIVLDAVSLYYLYIVF